MTTTTDTASLTGDVQRLLELQDIRERIDGEISAIKNRLATTLPAGSHDIAGTQVTVAQPSRRFNADKAWTLLTVEERAAAMSPDPKKMKTFLRPTDLDDCMDTGTGVPTVRVS